MIIEAVGTDANAKCEAGCDKGYLPCNDHTKGDPTYPDMCRVCDQPLDEPGRMNCETCL